MKARLICLSLLFFIVFPAGAQWKWVHPLPQGNALYFLDFVTHQKGIAMGCFGAVIISTDSGESWQQVKLPLNCNLYKFHFPDNLFGYAVGEDFRYYNETPKRVVMKTIDGGFNWFPVFHGETTKFSSLWFIDKNKGFTVGKKGILRKTVNGGMTWSSYCLNPLTDLSDIAFFDSQTGIITGESGAMYRTVNGGDSWIAVTGLPSEDLGRIRITGPLQAHIVLETMYLSNNSLHRSVNLLETDDAGSSWHLVKVLDSPDYISCSDFPSRDSGFVFSHHKMLRTTNSGISWDTVPCDLGFRQINFITGANGFALFSNNDEVGTGWGGDAQVYKTNDRGITWYQTTAQQSIGHFQRIEFPSPSIGYASGQMTVPGSTLGEVFKTTDGGEHWTQLTNPLFSDTYFIASWFTDDDTGVLGGLYGRLLRTTDGGATWVNKLVNSTADINWIWFRGADTGYAAGSYYSDNEYRTSIYTTTNGGASWIETVHPEIRYLSSLVFPSRDTGFMTMSDHSYNSFVLRSVNGGQIWEKQDSSYGISFDKLQFFNGHKGYMISNLYFYRTDDGGETWRSDSTEWFTSNPQDMKFINEDTGYVVTSRGMIFRTEDKGYTWVRQESGTANWLGSVCFASPQKVFTAGYCGVILSADNISGFSIGETIPENTALDAKCYPNPAKDAITVSIEMPHPGYVNIVIRDTWGRTCYPIRRQLLSKGAQSLMLDLDDLPSGLYYCSILADNHCETKKVVVIK